MARARVIRWVGPARVNTHVAGGAAGPDSGWHSAEVRSYGSLSAIGPLEIDFSGRKKRVFVGGRKVNPNRRFNPNAEMAILGLIKASGHVSPGGRQPCGMPPTVPAPTPV